MYLTYNINDYLRDRQLEQDDMIDLDESDNSEDTLAHTKALGKIAAAFYSGAKEQSETEDDALVVYREWLNLTVYPDFGADSEDDDQEE